MTSPIRVRCHTDGRVAVRLSSSTGTWPWSEPEYGERLSDEDVAGNGWVELFIAELPKPEAGYDGAWIRSDDAEITAEANGISVDGEDPADPRTVTADALKMLAAVAACEQRRQEANQE